MLFRLSTAIVSTLLLAQGALAALTPDQVVTNIGIVTAVSGDINNSLQSLTTSTGPANVGTISQVSCYLHVSVRKYELTI